MQRDATKIGGVADPIAEPIKNKTKRTIIALKSQGFEFFLPNPTCLLFARAIGPRALLREAFTCIARGPKPLGPSRPGSNTAGVETSAARA
jgi:hypothetical protein